MPWALIELKRSEDWLGANWQHGSAHSGVEISRQCSHSTARFRHLCDKASRQMQQAIDQQSSDFV